MGMMNEMISANIRNWLQNLAIGAKAQNKRMVCGAVEHECDLWKVTAQVYEDVMHDGIITVHLHNIKLVAEAAELDIMHRDFTPIDDYYFSFTGEDFFIFNGVKFSGLILGDFTDDEKEKRWEEHTNARKQSSDSEVSENESVADE